MFRTLYRLVAAVAITMSLSACSDDPVVSDSIVPDSPGAITIHFESSSLGRSTASDNSETRIRSIVLGLYPATAAETAPAVAWATVDYPTAVYGGTAVAVKLTDDLINTLFNNTDGVECRFYALANVPADVTVPEKASIETLRTLAISAPFNSIKVQDSFVMTATGQVKYSKPTNTTEPGKASGNGLLYRAAAKIRLNLQIPTEVVITDNDGTIKERWTPVDDADAIRVLINNGVNTAVAEPAPDEDGTPWKPADDSAYYKSDLAIAQSVRSLSKEGTGDYPYIMDVPLYTFPNAWEESTEETRKTTLTLIMPWHRVGEPEGQSTVFYYQVPVTPADVASIDRNYSYTINLKVGMLGSLAEDEPMEIDNVSYQIVNWFTEDVNVSLNNIRYLVLNPNLYYINNESEITIPLYTSHPVEITDFTMSYQRFNYPRNNTGGVVDIPISEDIINVSKRTSPGETEKIVDYSIQYKDGQYYVSIKHPMIMWVPVRANGSEVSLRQVGSLSGLQSTINEIVKYVYPTDYNASRTPEMAYFPYTFTFSVRHIDEPSFHEEATVIQYPGMYIVDDYNPGGSYFAYDPTYTAAAPYYVNLGNVFLNAKEEIYNGEYGSSQYVGMTVWKNACQNLFQDDYPAVFQQTPAMTEESFVAYLSTMMGGLRKYVANVPDDEPNNVINYNMYVLNITQLSADDVDATTGEPYTIGDPRAKFINNNLFDDPLVENTALPTLNWCQPARALTENGGKRMLKYYYPTDESEDTRMMVAPKLRVSSAYGFVYNTGQLCHKSVIRRRAATYQEQDYPAGRWRLPTYGEVSFICRLSAQGKIPVLFHVGQKYMTAQGVYEIGNNGILIKSSINFAFRWSSPGRKWQLATAAVGCNVRPVYDEWYWEEVDQGAISDGNGGYVFTYGDMPIEHNF